MNQQYLMVEFLRSHPGRWYPFPSDRKSVEIICALHNLGIARVTGDKYILRSAEKAAQFLNRKGV